MTVAHDFTRTDEPRRFLWVRRRWAVAIQWLNGPGRQL